MYRSANPNNFPPAPPTQTPNLNLQTSRPPDLETSRRRDAETFRPRDLQTSRPSNLQTLDLTTPIICQMPVSSEISIIQSSIPPSSCHLLVRSLVFVVSITAFISVLQSSAQVSGHLIVWISLVSLTLPREHPVNPLRQKSCSSLNLLPLTISVLILPNRTLV
jgi:hypothetical protein